MTRLLRLASPLALLLLCVGVYWKLALTDQYVWFDQSDMCYIEIPRLQFQADAIHRGQFPLWDPRIWAGQPLVGQTQPGPLYPFNLLFELLPLKDGYLRLTYLNWYYVFIHFQAALFCFWLARDLGRSRMAAMVSGCLFAFGGFVGSAAWLDVMNGAVWTPLVFLFLLRALRGQKPAASAILAGFFLGVAWLCGHHEIPMLVSYAAGFTLLFHFFRRGRPDWRVARLAAFFVLVAFLTSAVQTIPTYEFGSVSKRWVGLDEAVGWKDAIGYVVHTLYSLPVHDLFGFAVFGANQADANMFMGVVAMGLGAVGLMAGWNRPEVRWLAVVIAGALLFALGAATPLHGVLYALMPLLGKARVPVRALHLVHFGIAVLAAYGVDFVADRESTWARRIAIGLASFGGLIACVALAQAVNGRTLDEKIMLSAWVALGLSALIFAYRFGKLSRGAMLGSVLVLILVELTPLQNYPSRYDKDHHKFVRTLTENHDVADFLRRQPGPVRVAVNDRDIPANFGDWHGLDMLQGYVAGVSENLLQHELHTPLTRRLFAVTYTVARQAERPEQQEVFRGESGIKVFRNPEALPRAWIAHDAIRVNSAGELRIMIQNPSFDPRLQVALLGAAPPRLEQCNADGQVNILRHHSDRVTLQAELPCRGMVILADTNFPGWQARVDGKAAPIYETYGALRGLVVEAGSHGIEMRYRPWSVYVGGALTLLGSVLAIAACV